MADDSEIADATQGACQHALDDASIRYLCRIASTLMFNTTNKGAALKVGQKVRTVEGNVETVMVVEEARVITFESAARSTWYHPTKVATVYTNRTEQLARRAGLVAIGAI